MRPDPPPGLTNTGEVTVSLPEPSPFEIPRPLPRRHERQSIPKEPPRVDPDDPETIETFQDDLLNHEGASGPGKCATQVEPSEITGYHHRTPGGTRRWVTAHDARVELFGENYRDIAPSTRLQRNTPPVGPATPGPATRTRSSTNMCQHAASACE